jgi:hypothetical protein
MLKAALSAVEGPPTGMMLIAGLDEDQRDDDNSECNTDDQLGGG